MGFFVGVKNFKRSTTDENDLVVGCGVDVDAVKNVEVFVENNADVGNGNTFIKCSRASGTRFAALFSTERFTVHPVEMSVTVALGYTSTQVHLRSLGTGSASGQDTDSARTRRHGVKLCNSFWALQLPADTHANHRRVRADGAARAAKGSYAV
ncbi:hypothetical protein BAUR9175_03194 [Brevibacterium aurantiacum]|uniref:Uncharacterized protein n=1 Tax=Brevibacterium aurantiacum TaxID=273384 RepID=A0A2H1K7E5_BREAU|nr:hypothetical protein BAUR9175_03194 [Brevibacterium aurantiacum]